MAETSDINPTLDKHTPGPWKSEREYEDTRETFVHATGRMIADCNAGFDDDAANARLIAAAPDLLAAAREAYEHAGLHTADCERVTTYEEGAIFEDSTGCTCFLSRLRAAITKASA